MGLGEGNMKRLFIVVMVLALMVTTAGMAFAGVDWDGDPVLSVGGTVVNVDFGFDGDFILQGGQIHVLAEAPQIRLLDSGPSYVKAKVKTDGDKGHLLLTTTLSGKDSPKTFQVRVSVPSKGVEQTFTVKKGDTLDFVMPR
jgi:hypothetical protein